MNECMRCNKQLADDNEIYAVFSYPNVIEGVKSLPLCKNCFNRVYSFIIGYKNEWFRRKEECPACGKDDAGYAQGQCECGLMNK